MGAHSKRKGKLAELEVVRLARSAGLAATRTWHTAQATDPTERRCDVSIAGLPAQVKEIAATADPATRTFEARLTFDAPKEANVRPGMTATVTISVPLAACASSMTCWLG